MMQISYPPLRRLTDKISIRDIFNPDMTIGTEEAIVKRNVVRFDPLSVTLRFYSTQVNPHMEQNGSDPDAKSSYWESYLVQGSPYVTAKFNDVTPVFTPLSIFQTLDCPWDDVGNTNTTYSEVFGVCSKHNESLNGVQFLVRTQENLTWMIFASEPISLALDSSKRTIRSKEKFKGIIRLALIPPPLHDYALKQNGNQYQGVSLSYSQGVKRLIYHAHAYPVGATVSWDFQDIAASSTSQLLNSNHEDILRDVPNKVEDFTLATVKFAFQVKSMNSDSSKSTPILDDRLLMLALPHHAAVLPSNMILSEFDLEYQCIKGLMKPVVGSHWSYVEQLTDIGFDMDQDIRNLQKLSFDQEQVILKQVELDLGRVLPTLTENIYGFGKQIARLAQLCHIASILERPSFQSDATNVSMNRVLTSRATSTLHDLLTKFLDGFSTDNLLYDINFGGIITHNGVLNKEEDFGNGWYNDHHFHYGYILYASAILGRLNSTFVDEYGIHIDSILYDVAHEANDSSDSSGGAFFPFTRHKSWFDGHSFASGLFPFADGKSQESSSEAVNCYYGAYLWSLVRWRNVDDFQDRINFAKLLLAMEIRGAKTYWHMMPKNSGIDTMGSVAFYNQDFEQGLMVGNLGMMDVTVATWFGTQQLYVHMINFMPVTAITKELFSKPYIEKEFNEIIEPIFDGVEMAWRGYTISDKALIFPTEAWQDATSLRSYELDSALSQSQVYFWIASMNGFNASVISTDVANDDNSGHSSEDASCDKHQGCALLNLEGLCCPSSDGVMLGCCK
jgi:Predicted glycosyl hydrolase